MREKRLVLTREKRIIDTNSIALALLFVSNICFYTPEHITVYRILSGAGIIIALAGNVKHISRRIRIHNCIIWLALVYSMYMVNGYLRLQKGEFNGAVLAYRFFECIAFFVSISAIIRIDYRKIVNPFLTAGLLSLVFLIWKEGAIILAGGTRIGDTLSGNVNTVGFNLGIVSVLLIWQYCTEKNKSILILFTLFVIFMVLTGSRKALIIIVFDFLLVFIYQRERASTWLKLGIVIAMGIYAIFNVPYLYNIVGIRIESMFLTWRYGAATAVYSYSTDIREVMIKEGLSFFIEHPVFGGGYNYFYSRTSTHYDYSHCNYIELLTSFGIVGLLLFYSKYFSNLRFLFNHRRTSQKETIDLVRLSSILLVQQLILEWGAVSFSAQAVWYIPVILASAAIDQIRTDISR